MKKPKRIKSADRTGSPIRCGICGKEFHWITRAFTQKSPGAAIGSFMWAHDACAECEVSL